MTLGEYYSVLEAQGGRCCICNKELTGFSNAVDHDHKTGMVRGILCAYCNHWNLGRHTDWELVQRMADYLKSPPAVSVLGERKTPKKTPRKRRASKTTRSAKPGTVRPSGSAE